MMGKQAIILKIALTIFDEKHHIFSNLYMEVYASVFKKYTNVKLKIRLFVKFSFYVLSKDMLPIHGYTETY